MPSIISSYEYDIFISYRHNDNLDGWVTDFVQNLEKELRSTLKDSLTIYFDKNPHDGLLETHNVDKSLEGKLKCLIFIPIISQTYCDPKSFAWQQEFVAFNKLAQEDQVGRDIKLSNGNVASRILPIKIHDLDLADQSAIENEMGGLLRSIEFIYKEAGVNRPLAPDDSDEKNLNKTKYKNQVNKVANAIKELLNGMATPNTSATDPQKRKIEELRTIGTRHSKFGRIKWIVGIATIIIAALGYYYFIMKAGPNNTHKIVGKSVAVMPFVNLSSDKEQEYFSDGLTEDIITQLAKIKSLKVTSRTSVMQYKENPKSLKQVGEELGVTTILEGSVQRSGDQVRITAQLILAETDEHLWAESYDRSVKDIFSVQREVATAIAEVLKATLSGSEVKQLNQLPTNSTTAYDQYLKGRYLMEKREKEEMANAIIYFEKAVKEDSTFVDAISALANAYLLQSSRGWDDPNKIMPQAEKYIKKALRLAPESGPAHTALGFFLRLRYDVRGAEAEFRKSIEFEPNQTNVYNWLGSILDTYGDCEGAIKIYNQGLAYNPDISIVFGTLKANLIACLVKEDRDAEALTLILENNKRDWPVAFSLMAQLYWDKGNRQTAISFAEKSGDQTVISLYRDQDSTLFITNALKNIKQMEQQLKNREYVSLFALGNQYYDAGEKAKAFECYNKAIEVKDPYFSSFLKSRDPGREELRKKIMAVSQF